MSAPVIVLADLERAAAKATPGPWVTLPSQHRWHVAMGSKPIFPDGLWAIVPEDNEERLPIATVDCADDHDPPTRAHAEDDAVFIATASPATVAALSAALRQLVIAIPFSPRAVEDRRIMVADIMEYHGIVLDPREPAAGETPETCSVCGNTPPRNVHYCGACLAPCCLGCSEGHDCGVTPAAEGETP